MLGLKIGKIKKGYLADIVASSKNPAEDISALSTIHVSQREISLKFLKKLFSVCDEGRKNYENEKSLELLIKQQLTEILIHFEFKSF